MTSSFDAVVVGSGFGGGITACRLAQAGWRVCVLERGRRFGPENFISEPIQAPELLWHRRLNPDGIFDLRLFKDIVVLSAAGVGGGSLVYANVQLRAHPDLFDSGWPSEITYDVLKPFYERVESVLEPVGTPASPALDKMRAFRAMAAVAREEVTDLPIAVHFGDDRLNPFSGVPQQGCDNLARCNIGCPRHAKNTIDLTYIARAETEGAEVRPHCEVHRLAPPAAKGGRWKVGYRGLGGVEDGEVNAPVLVLSAGALGTTRLLLRNKRRLPGLSPALGTRFSTNGDALAAAFDPHGKEVRDARTDFGPVMTSRIDYWDRGRFMVADGGLPPRFTALLNVLRDEAALLGSRKLFSIRLKQLAVEVGLSDRSISHRDVATDLGAEPIDDSLVFLMMGQDAADGRMRLTPLFRRFDIQWDTHNSQTMVDAMRRATTELGAAAGADPFCALEDGPFGKDMTVHPLGGCPMADDAKDGVVDSFGQVHGYSGLHISDASIVPTAIGLNPSETIAALAERNVDQLIDTGIA